MKKLTYFLGLLPILVLWVLSNGNSAVGEQRPGIVATAIRKVRRHAAGVSAQPTFCRRLLRSHAGAGRGADAPSGPDLPGGSQEVPARLSRPDSFENHWRVRRLCQQAGRRIPSLRRRIGRLSLLRHVERAGGIAVSYYTDRQLPLTFHHEIFHQVQATRRGVVDAVRFANGRDPRYRQAIAGEKPYPSPPINAADLAALKRISRGGRVAGSGKQIRGQERE